MEQETKPISSVGTCVSLSPLGAPASGQRLLWVALFFLLLARSPALSEQSLASNDPPAATSSQPAPVENVSAQAAPDVASDKGATNTNWIKANAERAKQSKAKPPTNEVAAPRVLSPSPESAFTNRVYAAPPAPEPNPYADSHTWFLALAVFLAAALAIRKLLLSLSQHDPWDPQPDKFRAMLQRHCPTFHDFFDVLGAEPERAGVEPEVPIEAGHARPLDPDLLASTLAIITGLRARLAETSEEPSPTSRLALLSEVRTELAAINPGGHLMGLRPIWQLISLLDGLLAEVSQNAAHLTPSVLRTIAGGLDVLEAVSVVSLDSKLDSGPPVRLLAVDDDPISQHAIAFALKKVFPAPDIVANGPAALVLAGKHTYDLIFLDIELPEMDGFELCSRIHELPTNRETPVVFVTGHSDFDSRAQSAQCGAEDLIGKPYLTFEVALKALTLVLHSRLQPVRAQ